MNTLLITVAFWSLGILSLSLTPVVLWYYREKGDDYRTCCCRDEC